MHCEEILRRCRSCCVGCLEMHRTANLSLKAKSLIMENNMPTGKQAKNTARSSMLCCSEAGLLMSESSRFDNSQKSQEVDRNRCSMRLEAVKTNSFMRILDVNFNSGDDPVDGIRAGRPPASVSCINEASSLVAVVDSGGCPREVCKVCCLALSFM